MGRSSLFASEHEESESTAEGDPLRLDDDDDYDDQQENQIMVGAGVASGALGFLVGGPLFAVLLGFGTAYATQKEGAVGDSARAVGQVARTAQEQAVAVDQKHHLLEKSKQLAKEAWQKARSLDRQHHILDTAVDVVQFSWRATKNFCQRHRVVERGIQGTRETLGWLAEQIDQRTRDDSSSSGRRR